MNPLRWRIPIVFALIFSLSVLSMAFYYQDPVRMVQEKFIFQLFLTSQPDAASNKEYTLNQDGTANYSILSGFDPDRYPDTVTLFAGTKELAGYTSKPLNGKFLLTKSNWELHWQKLTPWTLAYTIYNQSIYSTEFISAFKNDIGISPYTRVLRMPSGEEWSLWSGPAIEKVFNKYYGKPNTPFQQVTYQYIYNMSMKPYMDDYVAMLNYILVGKRNEFKAWSKIYYQKAVTAKQFSGTKISRDAYNDLIKNFPGGSDASSKNMTTDEFIVGQLLRRDIEGSLPVFLKCLRIFLKDYDPENYRKLKAY
jgi:hypothetical protein